MQAESKNKDYFNRVYQRLSKFIGYEDANKFFVLLKNNFFKIFSPIIRAVLIVRYFIWQHLRFDSKKRNQRFANLNSTSTVYDILPPKRFLQVSKNILGIKEFESKNKKYLGYGWRISLATVIIFCLAAGISPWQFLLKSIEAITGGTRVIKLYAADCGVTPAPSYDSSGWWNAMKAAGRPELGNRAAAAEFNETNSAVYKGGNFNLACQNFKIMNPTLPEDEKEESASDISDINNENVNLPASANNSDLSNQDESKINNVIVVEPAEAPVDVKIIDAGQPLSLLGKIRTALANWRNILDGKNVFHGSTAWADEGDKELTGSDLGEFQSARIKFSFSLNDLINASASSSELAASTTDPLSSQAASSTERLIDPISNAANRIGEEYVSSSPAADFGKETSLDSQNTKVDIIDSQEQSPEIKIEEEKLAPGTESQASSTPAPEPAGNNNQHGSSTPISKSIRDLWSVIPVEAQTATSSETEDTKVMVWYALDDINNSGTSSQAVWHKLDSFNWSQANATLGRYFNYDAPFLTGWQDVQKLKIKFEGISGGQSKFVAYLDSVWVEAEYTRKETLEEKKQSQREQWQKMLKLISVQKDFAISQIPDLQFQYTKKSRGVMDYLKEKFGLASFWDNVALEAKIVDSQGVILNTPVTLRLDQDGIFEAGLEERPTGLKPGKYKIIFNFTDSSTGQAEDIDIDQYFTWGELAVNVNKSIYIPGEKANFSLAVLDDSGHTICNADLRLQITAPDGGVAELTSGNGLIKNNPACGPDNVIDAPDYSSEYGLAGIGTYKIRLSYMTVQGERAITDQFEVREHVPFDIERIGPTRIYPRAPYTMQILVKANEDYNGDLEEIVPVGFKIMDHKSRIVNNAGEDYSIAPGLPFTIHENENIQKLVWGGASLKAGDELILSYKFDAPDVSPAFYLLGPAQAGNFVEARSWQIASDALETRANTVQFFAGKYFSNGYGLNANATNTLPTFDFKLGESGATVKNAFIVLESQFEAFANNANNYASSSIGFDTCASPCAPDPNYGTGRVARFDTTDLAYDDTESNMVRLVLDVTSEAQLAAYAGNSQTMSGKIAFRFNNGIAAASIAYARATLYVTYTYNPKDTTTYTNTVTYPLESTAAGDSGTRRASQADDCVLNSTCPLFGYTMDMPDYTAASSSRLSQWFTAYNQHYNNTTADINANVNIQGNDTNSDVHVLEAFNSGQSTMLPAVFESVLGYTENTAQNLEYHATSSNAPIYYLIGGESTETYLSSSTAPTKTRTVSFPIGVINDGATLASTSASANVYFPENGSATGTVKIKKAWLRIITNNSINTAAYYTDVSVKVGSKATSTVSRYNYRSDPTNVKPSFNIIHVINSSDYSELEKANSISSTIVMVNTGNVNIYTGSISAELMITYTYTSEGNGYLSNLSLSAGQTATFPTQSYSASVANMVMPESKGTKTVRGGGLLASYLLSSSDKNMPGGATIATTTFDANLSTSSSPICVDAQKVNPDGQNAFVEFYKNVASGLNTTDNQTLYACYSNSTAANANVGAKINGILSYTYQWDNKAPTSTIMSALEKNDASGDVHITTQTGDTDGQDLRAKVEYEAGSSCSFSSANKATINSGTISADNGTPVVDNNGAYQIGTSTGYILTSSGSNRVYFDWSAKSNVGANIDSTYCLRFTSNDFYLDQTVQATSTVTVDTLPPSAPGALSMHSRTGTNLVVNFGATSTENHFREYKIYYKVYDGTPVLETGSSVLSSSTDPNLGNKFFFGYATTTINGLSANATYSMIIYAYDNYGNKASSTQVEMTTNDPPTGTFGSSISQTSDGSGKVRVSVIINDPNNSNTCRARIEYKLGPDCSGGGWTKTSLDEATTTISSSFGSPHIDNAAFYQVGTSSYWIWTAGGANTVSFDWLSKNDIPAANTDYCLRLTANDNYDDQIVLATTSVLVDNVNPGPPGNLTDGGKTTNSITLAFGGQGSDTHFSRYRIFYKPGTSGVSTSDTEKDDSNLTSQNYSNATSTKVTGLTSDTDYVFNIWTYDLAGNKAPATEVYIRTNSSLTNGSLVFVNPASGNIAVGDASSTWTFRAVVNELNGWENIASTTLRLADSSDNSAPFNDLSFMWDQNTNVFSDIGPDALDAAVLVSGSSTCANTSCTLDFRIRFNNKFGTSSTNYSAELNSVNDTAKVDLDQYNNFYQVKNIKVRQIHYRWRNDNGGE